MNIPEAHIADTLYEVHCRVSFLQEAASAFASMDDKDILPRACAWMGLNYFLLDLTQQVEAVKIASNTWQRIP